MPVGPCRGLWVLDDPSGRRRSAGRKQPRPAEEGSGADWWSGLESLDGSARNDGDRDADDPPRTFRNGQDWNLVREQTLVKPISAKEEGRAIQALLACPSEERALWLTGKRGGVEPLTRVERETLKREPDLIASGMHAGSGRLVFGWSNRQYADLSLIYLPPPPSASSSSLAEPRPLPSAIFHHNYHGSYYHYRGHRQGCGGGGGGSRGAPDLFDLNYETGVMDEFRSGLAWHFSAVRPEKTLFFYSTSWSCDFFHGKPQASASAATAADGLSGPLARGGRLTKKQVLQGISDGSLTGFATLTGGRETRGLKEENESVAVRNFGFCVQRYAPAPPQLSPFTKSQIARFQGLEGGGGGGGDGDLNKYLANLQPRTLNSGTFHSEETVSTTYLKWLMAERGFEDFVITHLALYNFQQWPGEFLKPILQERHDHKRKGNVVAAELLKLIGNGSFGYNGMEASNYSKVVIYAFLPALLDDIFYYSKRNLKFFQKRSAALSFKVHLMTDESLRKNRLRGPLASYNLKHITLIGMIQVARKRKKKALRRPLPTTRSRSSLASQFIAFDAVVDDDDDDDALDAGFDEEAEIANVLGLDNDSGGGSAGDDDQSLEYQFRFLYAVEVPGTRRPIFNNVAKACAVLSNSKVVFFSHVHVMLRCLDPRLAELCYIDTDSCIWSLTYDRIEDCLLPDKIAEWKEADILADENGPLSCHGKMKLEGLFRAAQFKTVKIYRLYTSGVDKPYTRCKGIHKAIGERLPDQSFCSMQKDVRVVHRTVLRPSKAGEMLVGHESKSLSVPYNLKRYVTDCGIHTFSFSNISEQL